MRSRSLFKAVLILLAAAVLAADGLLFAAPMKTGGQYELTVETLDAGGDPDREYRGGGYMVIGSLGEAHDALRLSGASGYELFSGYFGQDLLAPRRITNLIANLNVQEGKVQLQWNMTGDEWEVGPFLGGSRIYIASTTVLSEAQNDQYWYNRLLVQNTAEVKLSTANVSAGAVATHTLGNLVEGQNYYFRVWTLDQAGNWSELSTGATVFYLSAPGAVTDLNAVTGRYGRTIELTWGAPGDDGYTGQLPAGSKYAIQRSSWSSVVFSTYSVDTISVSTSSVNPGDRQQYVLRNLLPGVTYYIRLWTADENPAWSYPSNSTSTWANVVILSVSLPTTFYHFGQFYTGSSTNSATALNVVNDGNVVETYDISATNSLLWSIAPAPASDTFTMKAAFHGTRPTIGDYDARTNALSTSPLTASASALTVDGSQTGANVDPFTGDTRNLWFKFMTPLATSTSTQQQVTFTITAQESP